ncbi:MAG: hypothetical protein FJX65_05275 [Alphaproteobacteria bacterium]|nr:hypothetical protein [Alphaproteobacteria bacterium]
MSGVPDLYLVFGFLVIQRLIELAWAQRNTRRLLARGAVEIGRSHYPLFIALHGAWLAAILFAIPEERMVSVPLLAAFLLLQVARLWVIASLGPFWTTRIITLADTPLVRRGPYRLMRHPNYAVVVAEIAVVPLMFEAWTIALVFSILNATLLYWRIRVENAALAPRRSA